LSRESRFLLFRLSTYEENYNRYFRTVNNYSHHVHISVVSNGANFEHLSLPRCGPAITTNIPQVDFTKLQTIRESDVLGYERDLVLQQLSNEPFNLGYDYNSRNY